MLKIHYVFDIEIPHQRSHIAYVGVEGWLKTKDDFVLTRLHQEYSERDISQLLSAHGITYDGKSFVDGMYAARLSAELDEKVLKKIDEVRAKDPKKGIDFKLELVMKNLQSNVTVANFKIVDMDDQLKSMIKAPIELKKRGISIPIWQYDHSFETSQTNGWILSANGNPTYLVVGTNKTEIQYRIHSDDWIHEYAPKLGLGKRISFELVSDGELFKDTHDFLLKAEEAFGRWDIKSVYANCREIGTRLDDYVKTKYGQESFAYKERWGRAYKGHSYWSSLDLHNVEMKMKYPTDPVILGRMDAECLLISTKNLIKYAQEL